MHPKMETGHTKAEASVLRAAVTWALMAFPFLPVYCLKATGQA